MIVFWYDFSPSTYKITLTIELILDANFLELF